MSLTSLRPWLKAHFGLTSREQTAVLAICILFALGCATRALHIFGVMPK